MIERYVIVNENPNRDCTFSFYGTTHRPYWLEHVFVKNSSGITTNDITNAYSYTQRSSAVRQCKVLNNKYAHGGTKFSRSGCRYPDSCGEEGYAQYAPHFVVKKVKVTIELCED